MRQSNDAFHHPSPPRNLRCEPACTLPLSFVSSLLHRVLCLPLAFSFSFWRASDLVQPNISRSVVGSQPTVLIGSRYVIVSLPEFSRCLENFVRSFETLRKILGDRAFPWSGSPELGRPIDPRSILKIKRKIRDQSSCSRIDSRERGASPL